MFIQRQQEFSDARNTYIQTIYKFGEGGRVVEFLFNLSTGNHI